MKGDRNSALDFTRGMLLLTMFLYHCHDQYSLFPFLTKNLRFVSGSFVFVAGFIMSNIYLRKYNLNENKILRRLLSRAINLFFIFTLLNVFMHLILRQSYDGREFSIDIFIDNIFQIYILGMSNIVSFDILLPIAYLMIVIGMILFLFRKKIEYVIKIIALILLVYCSVVFYDKTIPYNIKFLIIGIFGAASGFVNTRMLDGKLQKYMYLVITAFVMNVILLKVFLLHYPVYFAGILINVLLFYLIGLKLSPETFIVNRIILLGQYSLLTYITHIGLIAFLKVLNDRLLQIRSDVTSLLLIFTVVLVSMFAMIEILDRYRKKVHALDRVYRFIFS